MEDADLIAVRVKDGIFIGNACAAEDHEFLEMNKVTHIVNCAGGEVADAFPGDSALRYLTFPWKDAVGSVCTTVMFDAADENVKRSAAFIDEAVEAGECVLVHSVHGLSRSPALVAAYFMLKYKWRLDSALSFIRMAHPDTAIKPHFMRQLRLFAACHGTERDVFSRDVDDGQFSLDSEQWMLRNTLLNGLSLQEQHSNELFLQCAGRVDIGAAVPRSTAKARHRITFIDTRQGTEVGSASSAPVAAEGGAQHVDPRGDMEAAGFTGSRGPAALREAVPTRSILSRSTSPCARAVSASAGESARPRAATTTVATAAPNAALRERSVSVKEPSSSRDSCVAKSSPTLVSLSASSSSAAVRPEAGRGSASPPRHAEAERGNVSYRSLAPPPPAAGLAKFARSPYAALASGHKYRNGSPLPVGKDKPGVAAKKASAPRTRVSSSPAARPDGPPGVASRSAFRSASKSRTGSPSEPGGPRLAAARIAVTRAASSTYNGIAPSRAPWNSSPRTGEGRQPPLAPTLRPPARDRPTTRPTARSRDRSASERRVTTRSCSNRRDDVKTRSPRGHSRTRSPSAAARPAPRQSSVDAHDRSRTLQGLTGGNGAVRRQPARTISAQRQ